MFPVTVFPALLGSGFQRRTFPFLWVPEISPCVSYQLLQLATDQLSVRVRVRVRVTLRLAVYRRQFVLATSPFSLWTSNFIFQLNACGYSPYVTFPLKRGWVYRSQLLLILASAGILRSESRGTRDHILVSQVRDSPNLESQVPLFIYPMNRVARLYPQALGSLFVVSYVSQDYGGYGTDRTENIVSISSYTVLCVSAAAIT
jgi:hypothetical protein